MFPFPMMNGGLVVVDYAHTPRALEAVLSVLRPRARRLLVVFGAPGESDPGKRPLMGRVVGEYADFALVTSDNPKGEDPATIAREVERGLEEVRGRYEIELDRKRAIERALKLAEAGDIVLLAGKGHERYQLIKERKIPHSDVDFLLSLGVVSQL
jgi:UDP-N-acetylmuramoyl-L-alanyl-D-glutamate--2,6-diaminopimelate ligase